MKGPLAVLKNASLTPAKSYMAPAVYSVQKLEELPMVSMRLYLCGCIWDGVRARV